MSFVTRTIALALLLTPATAAANPLDMFGFGARSTSLAGAVTATVSDVSSSYYNPAGAAQLRGVRAELGYFSANPHLRTDDRDNDVDLAHGVVGGVAAPGRIFGLPFAFALGVHLPDDHLSQVRALPQSTPRWELYSVRLQRLYLAASVALSPVRWLRLGAGLAFMASTRGGISIEGRLSAINAASSQLTHTVDADLTSVRYLQLGAQVDLPAGFHLGATYRDEFKLDTALTATLRGQIVVGSLRDPSALTIPGLYALQAQTLTAFQPRQVTTGVGWTTERWTLGVDVTWSQWSRYENPTASLDVQLELRIPPGLGAIRQPEVPQPTLREPTRFHDTVTPRLGVEYRAPVGPHTVAFRAGYSYDPTPVPAQAGVTNFVDADRHTAALGVGMALRHLGAWLPGALTLDFQMSAQFLPTRTITKADPTDAVGDYRAGGMVLQAGMTLGMSFGP